MKADMSEFIENREGNVLYSDPIAHVILPEQPYTQGHIRVFSKEPAQSIDELDDESIDHLFNTANLAASLLFELVDADGSNIIVNEGQLFNEHFHIDVLARYENDSLDTDWDAKNVPDSKMEDVQDRIETAFLTDNTDTEQDRTRTQQVQENKDADNGSDESKNYKIEHLKKLP